MSLKFSRQRESIRENLRNRRDHPTADMIYSDVRRICPNVSLGTVYRNLALLAEQGEITKIMTADGVLRYDGVFPAHGHFICRQCKRIEDLSSVDAETVMAQAQKDFSGQIEECEIIFYGLCEECQNL